MPKNLIPSSDAPTVFAGISAMSTVQPGQGLVTANIPNGGIAGFKFDIPGEARAEMRNDITQYHVEDNTTKQANIALLPKRVTLHGWVSELVLIAEPAAAPLTSAPNALPLNTPLVPTLSPGPAQEQAQTDTAESNTVLATQAQSQNLWQLYQGSENAPTRQSIAFGFFQQLRDGRVIGITVETPWGVFQNMTIEEVVAIQDETTRSISEFIITFVEFRTVTSATVQPGQLVGRAVNQNAESNPVPNGAIGTQETTDQSADQFYQGAAYDPVTAIQ